MATLLHEVIHNVTGLLDEDIEAALGPKVRSSADITNKLKGDCIH
jgi:hypothetical protein